MSFPTLPSGASPSREDAINLIIASIAYEELGLSHIINAEGEKLQHILGTLTGAAPLDPPATIDQILEVNDSVHRVLQSATETQSLLRNKLQTALNSAVMTGPTGATGVTGVTGATGFGSIIPYVGDMPGQVSVNPDATPNEVVFLAPAKTDINAIADISSIDMTGKTWYAIRVPQDGVIKSLFAAFTTASSTTYETDTVTVSCELYKPDAPGDTVYRPIAGTRLDIMEFTGMVPGNVEYSASLENLDISVSAGDRLLLVFYGSGTVSVQRICQMFLCASLCIE